MQKLLLALCLLFGACQSTVAQNYQGLRSQTFTATTSSSAIRNISSGISYHKLTWIPSGTVSSCSVKLDRSADGSSWSDLIAATSCTTGGMSAITAGTHNYVRITVSTFTGTGSVNVTWTGYINDPQPIDADDVVSADGWVNGHYPKASSNVFVESTLGASGTGACGAGQFVKTLNADAAPTCDTPAGGGDSVTVATTAATDPDFTQAGQVDFTLDTGATPDTIRADIEDGAVVNADINASAAIALSKLASTCPNSGAFVRCIYKTATDTIQSDDTPNLDDELIFPVGANDVWIIQVNLLMALTTNGDVSFDITFLPVAYLLQHPLKPMVRVK